jgi:hypothetical protein
MRDQFKIVITVNYSKKIKQLENKISKIDEHFVNNNFSKVMNEYLNEDHGLSKCTFYIPPDMDERMLAALYRNQIPDLY